MKRFGSLLLVSVVSSALTIGAFLFINSNNNKTVKVEHLSGTPVVGTTYTVNKSGEIVPLEFTEVAKKVMPAVVHIKSTQVQNVKNYNYRHQSDPFRDFFQDDMFKRFFGPEFKFESPQPQQRGPQARVGSGSGVIINTDGYIVTNNHVIANADDIEVTLDDNQVFKAKVVGTDPSTDLALLQIKEKGLPYLPLVNSDEVEVGEWVLAVGNPFNLNSTVTAGIVSATGRNINILRDQSAIESFIQTDAAINPGNSGGALVNLQGGLIGINTAIASPTGAYAGYGFAVPANIVSKVIEDLLKYGMVQRGYLGLMIRSVDGNLAKEKDLKVTEGVYVDSIASHSAAGEAGIEVGDVILKVNDVEVVASAKLLEVIGRHHPGDKVALVVNRYGKELEFLVTLRNQEGKTKLYEKGTNEILDVLGIELEEINKSTAKKLNIDGGIRITKLFTGKLKRHTDVKVGFIITKVDGKLYKTVDDLVDYLQDKKGGVMLEGVYEDYPGSYYYAFGL
ncbi:Do family serine endopeptidase [Carboxylicivirga sp. M1479]|uniref:Do family serine endopeptidase n=1 Tax=Carboxylicivirga sp. M1479 TaxID=2594476 RepID=UPI00117784A5|nr:Do family serine endopeptidase [Carboxylicivirga sp. M1479]TRX70364.1 Do family serine endopeptidase [Carboxylicivirga sp. M1479]